MGKKGKEKNFMEDERKKMEKPFSVGEGNQMEGGELIKPFSVHVGENEPDGMEDVKEEEIIKEEAVPKACFSVPLIKPFVCISEEAETLAKTACAYLQPVLGNMSEMFTHMELAFEKGKQEGITFPALLPGIQKANWGMLNFGLELLGRVHTFYDTEMGEQMETAYKVLVAVTDHRGKTRTFQTEVASDKIKGLEWLKKSTHSLATLPRNKDEKVEYQELVQSCIETEDVREEFLYPRSGWRDVPGYGWKYVYREGMIGGGNVARTAAGPYNLNLNEPQLGVKETFLLAIEMKNICRNGIASLELLLYVHASMLRTLFEKAGYPLDFVFGLMGVTNSRKTSLALAMAKLFDRDKMAADAEFTTATACGIEKTLSLYGDSVVFVDDFKPGVSKLQQREMDRKLDELVRFYGNRVAKKRMTDFRSDGDKKYFPIGGGCVLTMEILTGVTSSLTRMFVTELSLQDVDNEKLRLYQENIWILPTHMFDFICWVTGNFEKILGYIRERFPKWREQYPCEIGRFSGMYGLMMTTANLLASYGTGRGFWRREEAEGFVKNAKIVLMEELKRMEDRLKRRDKGQIIIRAFLESLHVSAVPIELNVQNAERRADFYEDGTFYYIQARRLRQLVEDFCRKYHERVEFISDDEMLGLLEKLGVLEVLEKKSGRERARKLPIQKGNAKRYLYLAKEKLREE